MTVCMNAYLQALKALLEQQANPEAAGAMSQYMRNQFPFLGIKSPQQKALFKQFIDEQGLPKPSQVEPLMRELWDWPQREYQYVALSFLGKFQKQLTPQHLPLFKDLIVTKSWWDTVDVLASHSVGKVLLQHPESREAAIAPWRQSDNLWLRRTTLLFQLSYKAKTDEALLFELIQENQASKEFFIQKAIGWALREYSKTDPKAVKAFVGASDLAPLSQREAMKWMKARGLAD
jgi:3-methyladenine DNA glycosylase AlkD